MIQCSMKPILLIIFLLVLSIRVLIRWYVHRNTNWDSKTGTFFEVVLIYLDLKSLYFYHFCQAIVSICNTDVDLVLMLFLHPPRLGFIIDVF